MYKVLRTKSAPSSAGHDNTFQYRSVLTHENIEEGTERAKEDGERSAGKKGGRRKGEAGESGGGGGGGKEEEKGADKEETKEKKTRSII